MLLDFLKPKKFEPTPEKKLLRFGLPDTSNNSFRRTFPFYERSQKNCSVLRFQASEADFLFPLP